MLTTVVNSKCKGPEVVVITVSGGVAEESNEVGAEELKGRRRERRALEVKAL